MANEKPYATQIRRLVTKYSVTNGQKKKPIGAAIPYEKPSTFLVCGSQYEGEAPLKAGGDGSVAPAAWFLAY